MGSGRGRPARTCPRRGQGVQPVACLCAPGADARGGETRWPAAEVDRCRGDRHAQAPV